MSDTFDHELDAALAHLDAEQRRQQAHDKARGNLLIKAMNARNQTPSGPTRDFMSAVLLLLKME